MSAKLLVSSIRESGTFVTACRDREIGAGALGAGGVNVSAGIRDNILVWLKEVSDVREGEPAHLNKAEERLGAKHTVAQWFFSGCMCQSVAIRPGTGSKISGAFSHNGICFQHHLVKASYENKNLELFSQWHMLPIPPDIGLT